MRFLRARLSAAVVLTASLAGCSDSNMGEVSLQLATSQAPLMTGQLRITLGSDEIVLDQIRVVLRKLRLEGGPTASCSQDAEGDPECGELELGPVLFDLPLDEAAVPTLNALVPVGTYDRFKFQIHKPSDANADADLVAQYPEMEGVSLRATGTYNGMPFTFASDLTEVETLTLAEAVEVVEDGELPLTLYVEAAGWFTNEAGTGLVDPAQANDGQPYESEVEQNIREGFRAFRDANRDGVED